jgi:hypothetical protein
MIPFACYYYLTTDLEGGWNATDSAKHGADRGTQREHTRMVILYFLPIRRLEAFPETRKWYISDSMGDCEER